MPQSVLTILTIAVLLGGGILLVSRQLPNVPQAAQIAAPALPEQLLPLSAAEKQQVKEAQEKIILNDGHDYSALYDLLALSPRGIDKINAICQGFNPVYCYKKASEQNPALRSVICARLATEITKRYGERVSASNHRRECLLGIPAYAY